jgi:hypothetical protein
MVAGGASAFLDYQLEGLAFLFKAIICFIHFERSRGSASSK